MAALTNTQISVTYVGLLKTSANTVLSSTGQQITDGEGNNSILFLSTAGVGIGGAASSGKELDVTGNVLVTGDLIVDNIKIDGNTISATSGVVTLADGAIATTQSQNDNSTKIATTAYVDTAIDGVDTLAEILAIGNTTGGSNISVSSGDAIILANDGRIKWTNDDVYIAGTTSGDNLSFVVGATELMNIAQTGGVTISTSLGVSTNLTVSGGGITLGGTGRIQGIDTVSASTDAASKGYVDTQISGINTLAEILSGGNTTGGTDISVTTGDDITFAANSKAIFNSALQIYNTGSQSVIFANTNNLLIDSSTFLTLQANSTIELKPADGENGIKIINDGAVELYHDNSKKFETTATGVTVTGSGIIENTSATTNDSVNVLDLKSLSSGTTANGFGVGVGFFTENSTYSTVNEIGRIEVVETSEANLNDKMIFYVKDNNVLAERLNITGSGATFAGIVDITNGILDMGQNRIDGSSDNLKISADNSSVSGSSTIEFLVDGSEKMRINNSGNVGIGETNPAVPLHITRDSASGENIALLLDNNNTTAGNEIGILFRSMVGSTNTDFEIFGKANGANDMDLVFESDGSNERVRFTADGNVGIGTSSPDRKLHVNSSTTNIVATFESTDATAAISLQDNSTTNDSKVQVRAVGDDFNIVAGGSQRLTILNTGSVGIGTDSPLALLNVNTGASGTHDAIIISRDTHGEAGVIKQAAGGIEIHSQKNLTLGADEDGSFTGTSSNVIINTDGSEKMRIDSSGNVGIGETSTDARLHITALASGGISNIKLESPGASKWAFGIPASETYLAFDETNDDLSTPTMVITKTTKRLGIGTTTPQKDIHIEGASGASASQLLVCGASDTIGHTAGILLRAEGGESDSALRAKGAIFFEREAANGLGKLHLCNNNSNNNDPADLSDAALTINQDKSAAFAGRVIIGDDAITTVKPQLIVGDNTNGGKLTIRGLSPTLSFDKTGSNNPKILTDGGLLQIKSGHLDAEGSVLMSLTSTGDATFAGSVSAASEYRLAGNSFSRVAIVDSSGSFAGGYNFNINSNTPQHDSTGALAAYYYNNAGHISFYTNSSQSAGTAAAERMRIDSAGNVGINVTSISRKFQIDSSDLTDKATALFYTNAIHTASDTNAVVAIRSDHSSSTGDVLYVRGDGTGNLLTLDKGGSVKLVVDDDGNSTFAGSATFAKSIEVQGDISQSSEGGHIILRANSGGAKEFGIDVDSSNNFRIITEDDGTNNNGVIHFTMSNTGAATFAGDVTINGTLSGAGSFVPVSGGTFTGNVNLANSTATSLSQFTLAEDAANSKFLRLHYLNSSFSGAIGTNIAASGLLVAGSGATGGMVLRTDAAAPIIFATNGTLNERMRIDSSGQVGIGTTSPQSLLHISSTAPIISLTDTNSFSDANDRLIFRAGSNEGLIQWYDDSASSTSTIAVFESNGNVGIGTSSPESRLHISSNGSTLMRITGGGSSITGIDFGDSDNTDDARIRYSNSNRDMDFFVANASRMNINSGGDVKIGSSGTANLYLGNIISASSSDRGMRIHTNNANAFFDFQGESGDFLAIRDFDGLGGIHTRHAFGIGTGSLVIAGSLTQNGSPSDKKYKENIKTISNGLDKIQKLNPVEFDWNDKSEAHKIGKKEDAGFIAQEVQKVLPNLVNENVDGDLSLNYEGVIPYLVQSIQELKKEIEILKSK